MSHNVSSLAQLLRLKCEAYTTMNDSDEDEEAERRLNDRMVETGGTFPPKLYMLAPAALYLTAILEYVLIISTISRRLLTCRNIDMFASAYCVRLNVTNMMD